MEKISSSKLFGPIVLAFLASVAALVLPAAAAAEPLPLQVTPSPAIFPTTTVSEQGKLEIEVFNPGDAAPIEQIAIEGPDAGSFDNPGSCGTIQEGQKCILVIVFTPTEVGEKTATAAIRFSGGERPEETFELRGTAVAPELALTPPSFDFGLTPVNSGSREASFTIENTGAATTQIDFVNFVGNSNNFGFDSNSCNGRLLQPDETCTIRVFFGPNEERHYSVQLQVNSAGQSFAAEIEGEGARPKVAVTPKPAGFAPATVGSGGPVQTVTVSNVGLIPVGFFIAVISGGDAGSFQLLDENCTGIELKPAESCTAHVRFRPISAGPKAAKLSLFGEGEGGEQIPLEGQGIAAAVVLTPSSPSGFDFHRQIVGGKSPSHTFAVVNSGVTPLELAGVSIIGADLDQFALASDTCTGATLGAGGECRVGVRFVPDSAGAKSAVLRVSADAGALSAALSGIGTAAGRDHVSFDWRTTAARVRKATALRVGTASCHSAVKCAVTITARLEVVVRSSSGGSHAATRNLPKLQIRVGAHGSQPLDLRLPRQTRELLDRGKARLSLKASWTSGDQRGRGSAGAKAR